MPTDAKTISLITNDVRQFLKKMQVYFKKGPTSFLVAAFQLLDLICESQKLTFSLINNIIVACVYGMGSYLYLMRASNLLNVKKLKVIWSLEVSLNSGTERMSQY